jgi:glycosyltransferase involved in cell wall biosynthesis
MSRKKPDKKHTQVNEIDTVMAQASAFFKLGQFQNAYNLLEPWVIKEIPIPSLYLLAAQSLDKLGRIRDASYTLASGLLLNPLDWEIRNALTHLYQKVNGKFITANFDQTNRPAQIPSISLVMIVKNEEKDLPRCLTSFQDIVQEIIIIDTGSTDRTVEIAKSFGARVEFFQWEDDFAAARNESLKYATCEWIIRVDADEYIEEQEKTKLIHAILSGVANIYLCPTYHPSTTDTVEMKNVRLFRNHLGIYYTNPIHESVSPTAVKLGLTQAITNIKILHTGNQAGVENSEKKFERNLQVCEKGIQKDPDNYYLKLVRATSIFEHHPGFGIAEMEDAIRDLPDETLSVSYLAKTYIYLGYVYSRKREKQKLTQLIRLISMDYLADRRMLQCTGELLLYALGQISDANRYFRLAHGLNDSDQLEGTLPIDYYNLSHIRELLIETSVLMGDYSQARQYLKLLVGQEPHQRKQSKEDRLQVGRFSMAGQHSDVINQLKDFSDLSSEDRHVLAKSYQATGQWQKAVNEIIAAGVEEGLLPKDYFELAICQMQLDRLDYAIKLLEFGRKADPNNPVSYNLESLIALKENHPDKALELSVQAFIGDVANHDFQDNLQKISALKGITPVQALKEVGLKWLGNGNAKNGLFALLAYIRFQPEDSEVRQIVEDFTKQN